MQNKAAFLLPGGQTGHMRLTTAFVQPGSSLWQSVACFVVPGAEAHVPLVPTLGIRLGLLSP